LGTASGEGSRSTPAAVLAGGSSKWSPRRGFRVVGLDVSYGMLRLARRRHTGMLLAQADLGAWAAARRFDLVVAWDSSFHLPLAAQARAVESLCALLAPGGVLLFTAGGARGETTGTMHGESFLYGSLAVAEYAEVLRKASCEVLDFEHDQPPADHVCITARRTGSSD
jgi:trans-aconitate methyltransferase